MNVLLYVFSAACWIASGALTLYFAGDKPHKLKEAKLSVGLDAWIELVLILAGTALLFWGQRV